MIQILITDGLFAALAGMGFGIVFNPQKEKLLLAGLFAAIGHALRLWLMTNFDVNICIATFFGALFVGVCGFFAGRLFGCPAEIFAFPAVLPMIPGLYAYKTILSVVKFLSEKSGSDMARSHIEDILTNGIISASIMFAIVLGSSASVFIDTLSSRIENRKMLSSFRQK